MPKKMTTKNANGACEPFLIDHVPWEEFGRGKFGMRYQQLGDYAGATQLGVCMEILDAGKQANQSHFHYLEEEHLLLLEGELTLKLGEHEYLMTAGHYVCFPAGQKIGHSIYNHSNKLCRYLVFSNRHDNDVIVYPDSDKIRVRATGELYQKSRTLDYWDNVED